MTAAAVIVAEFHCPGDVGGKLVQCGRCRKEEFLFAGGIVINVFCDQVRMAGRRGGGRFSRLNLRIIQLPFERRCRKGGRCVLLSVFVVFDMVEYRLQALDPPSDFILK